VGSEGFVKFLTSAHKVYCFKKPITLSSEATMNYITTVPRRLHKDIVCFAIILVVGFISVSGYSEDSPRESPYCSNQCTDYKKEIKIESIKASMQNATYLPPWDTRPIIKIRTKPGKQNPVDDVFQIQTNGRVLWTWSLAPGQRKDQEKTIQSSDLDYGLNKMGTYYADLAPQDAHFFVDLGGVAFCSTDPENFCKHYEEGFTFGSKIVNHMTSTYGHKIAHFGELYIFWRSELVPPSGCKCENKL
jgi:hypothetical protein